MLRRAGIADARAITPLVTQLGYPATVAQIEKRLGRLLADPGHAVFVADLGGTIVGMAAACMESGLHDDALLGRVTAAVVDAESRGRGIGASLVQHMEDWCREQGAERITLTSASHRAGAHKFYAALGYEQSGVRFNKPLKG